jgi:CelD/BcsL family acetyltransferase involved in cellulose biosynthesis
VGQFGPERFVADDRSTATLEALITWKRAQYQRTGVRDRFAHPWILSMLRRLFDCREADFGGILSTLYLGDRPIAAHFGIRSRHTWHYWFPAYDVDLARFSPGLNLLLHMCEAAARFGLDVIDLGQGDAGHYKVRFATGTTPHGVGSVEVPSPAAFLRHAQRATDRLFSRLPLGRLSQVPQRAFARIHSARKLR